MSDGISENPADLVGVLTKWIEARFGMDIGQMKTAVAAAPTANSDATDIVKWHGLLVDAQSVLERAEDDLLAALQTQPSTVDDPTMELAHRVAAAVTARDGRALVLGWLLDPDAPGKKVPATDRLARLRPRTGPAVQTSPPLRPAGNTVPANAWRPAGAAR
ncbi:hypothetical protein GR131_27930 [Streptomyces sp. GF20]|uniref:hypothetical protein n=1 Tax=Streptomyces sp. GF20 TaxID=2692235 RepID=UPI001315CFF9|nr:hypothetical protein [Streptomyces sp. GF20]QHC18951.1 hypothetical protein GR131_27930 [Streptomyces sp. GF20]